MIGKIIPQCELLRLYISVRDNISLPGKFLYRSLVFLREIKRDIRTEQRGRGHENNIENLFEPPEPLVREAKKNGHEAL